MRKLTLYIFLSIVINNTVFSQKDTTFNNLNELVVTATRTERKLGNSAVPVNIISEKTIKQAASLRLNDVLNEQAGLFLTAGFGTGVQMQGLSPDYTLILLNGEPFIGRTAGVLDLNRITVGNIQKIEIVKGPSSSLYGSEAMAGVINIITKQPVKDNYAASLRYGTYNTIDANFSAATKFKKLMVQTFVDRYSTDGYSTRPNSVERTVAPLTRLTNQLQISYPFSNRTKLRIGARYGYENITNLIAVTNTGSTVYSEGKEVHNDFNLSPVLTHQFSKKVTSSVRLYHSYFKSTQDLNTTSSAYNDLFIQQFYRAENQTDWTLNDKLSLNIGGGYLAESVRSSRYDNQENAKRSSVAYGFIQNEFKASDKITFISGFRYDKNEIYASAFSPKLAMHLQASNKLSLNASIGRGFKAPDFRQLYLNFTNTAAGSYSVFGVLEAQTQISHLAQMGQIASYENDYYNLIALKPEFSTGINVGGKLSLSTQSFVGFNIFRNDIENLIDSRLVANYKNGAQIFSYLNVNNAYTQGVDLNFGCKFYNHFTLTSGYQLLFTADKQQVEDIKKGIVYTKDASGIARKMNINEYYGLPNRSRHMANIKLLYEKNNYFINTRAIYRSKWAVSDKDGNGVYNTNDEFAAGFVQFNVTLGKQFNNGFSLQTGCDNIFNYADANNLPNMIGRNFYITINYQFKNKKSK
ncbi:MAG: TonB-dependent receptor plug domain-containing protein [Chitinophagaceae bacterium]